MEETISKPIKKPACKTMILNVFKDTGKTSMSRDSIMSQIDEKYNYNKQVFIKNALKKLIDDKIFLESNGDLKLNPGKAKKKTPTPNKSVLAAKKTTATAKRALKKTPAKKKAPPKKKETDQ